MSGRFPAVPGQLGQKQQNNTLKIGNYNDETKQSK